MDATVGESFNGRAFPDDKFMDGVSELAARCFRHGDCRGACASRSLSGDLMCTRDLNAKRREQTLDELEGVEWDRPNYDSYLVTTCHRLRKTPIGEFSTEDLRIMIGQEIGLFFLVPLALEALEGDPLAEGDYHPGDLLSSLLRVTPTVWRKHADWKSKLDHVVERLTEIPEELAEGLEQYRKHTT